MRQKLPQAGREKAYRPLPPPPTPTHPLSGHLPWGGGKQRPPRPSPGGPAAARPGRQPPGSSSRRLPSRLCCGNGAGSRGRYSHAREERETQWNWERRCAVAADPMLPSTQPGPAPSRRRAGKGGACGGREGSRESPGPLAIPPLSAPQEGGRKLGVSLAPQVEVIVPRWR